MYEASAGTKKQVAFVQRCPLVEVQLYYYNAILQKKEKNQVTAAVI